MSYHDGPTSPPSYESDLMSPVSQRTPKRRRIESSGSLDLEPFHHSPSRYSPPADPFDNGVFSPIQSGDIPSSLQINHIGDPFSMSHWDSEFLWDPLPPLNSTSQPPQPPQNPQTSQTSQNPQNNHNQPPSVPQSTPAPPNTQNHPQFGSYFQVGPDHLQQTIQQARSQHDAFWNVVPVPQNISYRPMPPAPYRPPQEHGSSAPAPPPRPNDPSVWASPQLPSFRFPAYTTTARVLPPAAPRPRPAPAPPAPRKGGISLALTRANATSIENLPEHKRECPACQLEFEPDDYLAVISCCGTATHAVCMSAWVNSQAYAKTKVCMKCRKLIDARRSLNNIVPPVTDKSWDRGQDFAAPESVQADTKIEFDISGRSESATRRHYRREMANYMHRQRGTTSVAIIPETDVPARFRAAYRELVQGQTRERGDLELRYHNARSQWRSAFEAEAQSASAVSIAKEQYQLGNTQAVNPDININALSDAVKAARKEQEKRHSEFRLLSKEYDEVKKGHETSQFAFLERVTRQIAASEANENSSNSSE